MCYTKQSAQPTCRLHTPALQPVTGTVEVRVDPGKKLEHIGIKVEMLGQIEMFYDRGNYFEVRRWCALRTTRHGTTPESYSAHSAFRCNIFPRTFRLSLCRS